MTQCYESHRPQHECCRGREGWRRACCRAVDGNLFALALCHAPRQALLKQETPLTVVGREQQRRRRRQGASSN